MPFASAIARSHPGFARVFDADDWDVMSFNAYDGLEAVVFAFSGRAPGHRPVPLRGLDPARGYKVRHLNDGSAQMMNGGTLSRDGLAIPLSANAGNAWHLTADRSSPR